MGTFAETDSAPADTALAEAAAELYALTPGEFVAARTRWVRTVRGREDLDPAARKTAASAIGALRRPTGSAWLVNRLGRRRPDVVERLADLGARLRRAQSRLDASALRSLRENRETFLTDALAALTEAVEGVAGAPARSDAALAEVRATLVAALSDEAALDAVRSGALTRALSYSGLGEVDLSDAVGLTPTGVRLQVVPDTPGSGADERATDDDEDRGDEDEAAASERADAEQTLAEAEATVQQAGEEVRVAREEARSARARVEELRAALREAVDADEQANRAVTEAVRRRRAAERARQDAEDVLDAL